MNKPLLMSSSTPSKRAYVKLAPAVWGEIDALWSSGEATLAELSDRYGITSRAAQARFAKHGVVKGSAARAVAIKVKERVLAEVLPDEDQLVQRAKDVKESTYQNAVMIENMIVARLNAAATDPSTTFTAAASIKMLGVAAQALERIHTLKRAALGISDDSHLDDDLPVLAIADLSEEEIAAMRSKDDDDADIHEEANEVVTVGECVSTS